MPAHNETADMTSPASQRRTLIISPAIDDDRWCRMREMTNELEIINCRDAAHARDAIREADGFFGKLTPDLLANARRLRWVQSPTASLEHYLFPELIEHPCVLTNMRGLFSDVIADHVLGLVLCFARNLHTYIRRQLRGESVQTSSCSCAAGFNYDTPQVVFWFCLRRQTRHQPLDGFLASPKKRISDVSSATQVSFLAHM